MDRSLDRRATDVTANHVRGQMLARIPWGLVGAAVLVAGVGIYNLASASRPPSPPLWQSQLAYLGIGLVVVLVVSFIDSRLVQQATAPIYVLNLAALVALKFVGYTAKGAESWFAIGSLRVQPAEFMKIGMILMMAKYFHDEERRSYGVLQLIPAAVIALVPIGLVLAQPDLGTALMMVFTALTVIAFSKPRWPVLALMGLVAVMGVGILWNDYVRPQSEPRWTLVRHHLKKHQESRISCWLEPSSDLKGSCYHAMQSKIAVGSGGTGGKGWKEGTQTSLRYLPEQHTDFIFSVFAEEQGFLKSLGLLVIYGILVLSALGVAASAKERFGVFVAVGVTAMIFWQVFENIGMVTGLLPITGITLPLLSYGGSSMISVMVGIGLLVNISRHRQMFSG